MSRLRITWKKSAIGYDKNQKKVVVALGLRSLNSVVEHENSPQIRGMVKKIEHLVAVEEIGEEGAA